MGEVRLILIASVAAIVAASPAASPAADNHVLRAAGLAVVAPRGWHLAQEQLSECSSPKQVLAVTNVHGRLGMQAKLPRDRSLVLLLEDDGYVGTGFPPRRRFHVPARLDVMGGCCEMPFSRGFELIFRDEGRNLYAFVYAANRPNADRAVAILNTLRVS
jgi:hypothetical protein